MPMIPEDDYDQQTGYSPIESDSGLEQTPAAPTGIINSDVPPWEYFKQQAAPAAAPRKKGAFHPDVDKAIDDAVELHGADRSYLRTTARIESGGDPRKQTGSYKGTFQLSDDEFKRYGGTGDIFDPFENAKAAALKAKTEAAAFEKRHGRTPLPNELYLTHQQGEGGFDSHTRNPDAPAWENMYRTAEGRQKGPAWAKQAVWGNLPDSEKRRFGSVENVTSRDFTDAWDRRYRDKEAEDDDGPVQVAQAPRVIQPDVPPWEYFKKNAPKTTGPGEPPPQKQPTKAEIKAEEDERRSVVADPSYEKLVQYGAQKEGIEAEIRQIRKEMAAAPQAERQKYLLRLEEAGQRWKKSAELETFARPTGMLDIFGGNLTPEQAKAELDSRIKEIPGQIADQERLVKDLEAAKAKRPNAAPSEQAQTVLRELGRSVESKEVFDSVIEHHRQKLDELKTEAKNFDEMQKGLRPGFKLSATRSGIENVLQGVGNTVTSIPKFAGYAAGYLGRPFGISDPETNSLVKASEWVEDLAKIAYPSDPARQKDFSQKLSQGAGSMIGFMGVGKATQMLTGGSRVAGTAGTALTGGASQGAETVEEATTAMRGVRRLKDKDTGKTTLYTPEEKDRLLAAGWGFALGLSEALPIDRAMRRPSGGEIRKIFEHGRVGAIEESAQEFGQSVGGNLGAKWFYDPTRDLFEGTGEATLIGGILGYKMGAAKATLDAWKGRHGEAKTEDEHNRIDKSLDTFFTGALARGEIAEKDIEGIRDQIKTERPEALTAFDATVSDWRRGAGVFQPKTTTDAQPDDLEQPGNVLAAAGARTGRTTPPPLPDDAQQPALPVPAAPLPPTTAEVSVLQRMGYTPDDIRDMDPDQRAAEMEDARSRGILPDTAGKGEAPPPVPQAGAVPPPLPGRSQVPDNPSAEPVADILAQTKDLADPKNPRQGVYLSRANLEALGQDDAATQQVTDAWQTVKGEIIDNVDGNGGLLAVKSTEVAQQVRDALANGEDLQAVLGRVTGAGQGKPANASAVVQQITPEGAVTRESAVAEGDIEKTLAEFRKGGREARVVTPDQAIARREQERQPPPLPTGDGSRSAPVKVQKPEDVARASERVAEPTDGQRDAGNYKHGHIKFQGLEITIENPKGSIRRGTSPDGTAWQVTMPATYGYVKRTEGRDGDQVDVYVGDNPQSDRVFVVDQVDPDTGKFDEHKVFLGYSEAPEVKGVYRRAFSDGRADERLGGITLLEMPDFKDWLAKGKRTRPVSKLDMKSDSGSVQPTETTTEQADKIPDNLTDTERETLVKAWRYVNAIEQARAQGRDIQQVRLDIANELDADLAAYGISFDEFPSEQSLREYLGSSRSEDQGRDESVEAPEAAQAKGDTAAGSGRPERQEAPVVQREQENGRREGDGAGDGTAEVVKPRRPKGYEDYREINADVGDGVQALAKDNPDGSQHTAWVAADGTVTLDTTSTKWVSHNGDEYTVEKNNRTGRTRLFGPSAAEEVTKDLARHGGDFQKMFDAEFPDFEFKKAPPPDYGAGQRNAQVERPSRYDGDPLSDENINLIVDQWNYVREVAQRPKIQSLTSYVIEVGGINDDRGEVRHIAGSAKERPGLVNKKGMDLDDIALSAWQSGFMGDQVERPSIADFLERLQDDLHTGTVVRTVDEPLLEDVAVANEIERELSDYGVSIKRFRSEAKLREYFGQKRPNVAGETEGVEADEPAAEGRKGQARVDQANEIDPPPFDAPAPVVTSAPSAETDPVENWWRRELTPAGRTLAVQDAGLKPRVAKMAWQHLSTDEKAALSKAYQAQLPAPEPVEPLKAKTRAEFLDALMSGVGDRGQEVVAPNGTTYRIDFKPRQNTYVVISKEADSAGVSFTKGPVGQTKWTRPQAAEEAADDAHLAEAKEAGPEWDFTPNAGWRDHLIRARVYAAALKIDHRGMELPAIVEAIDRKLSEHQGVPEGITVRLSDWTLDDEEARLKGGEYKAIAERKSPWSVVDGYGDTPEAARKAALDRLMREIKKSADKQTSLVPEATIKEKIQAAAKAKEQKGKDSTDDAGELFNPDAGKQTDLVEMAKAEKNDPYLKSKEAARDHVLTNGRKMGTEYGMVVMADGSTKPVTPSERNSKSYLEVSAKTAPDLYDGPARSADLHHNHPKSSSFSRADYTEAAVRPALRRTWVHGHDGSEYWASFKTNDPVILGKAYDIAMAVTERLTEKGYDLPRYRTHMIAIMMRDGGVIEYGATLRPARADERISTLREKFGEDAIAKAVEGIRNLLGEQDVYDRRPGSARSDRDVGSAPARVDESRPEAPGSEAVGERGQAQDRGNEGGQVEPQFQAEAELESLIDDVITKQFARKGKEATGPLKIGSGDILRSQSGREMSPAPNIDATTSGRATNSIKRMNAWLHAEAIKEVDARPAGRRDILGNDSEKAQLRTVLNGIDPKKATKSDQDTLNDIVFGSPEGATEGNLIRRHGEKPSARKAAKAAGSAARNVIKGMDEVATGLATLFGAKSNRVGSGPSFDEDTYRKAVPFFKSGISHFSKAGSDIKTAVRELVSYLADTAGMSKDTILDMKPYLVRFVRDIQTGVIDPAKGDENAPDSRQGVERDREAGRSEDSLGQARVPDERVPDGSGTQPRDGKAGKDTAPARGGSVPDGDAAAVGTGRDRGVSGRPSRDERSPAGSDSRGRGGDAGVEGVPAGRVAAEAVSGTARRAPSLKEALAAQKEADATVPFELNDPDNIRAALPALKPAQQDDVVKAESRFSQPEGHGFLLTNGTGTGKTWSGLGVIKRFVKQDKANILVLAPSQGILDGWVATGRMLGVDITRLPDTKTAGKGVVATTYANMAENEALAERKWDLIVADEAHKLSQNESGSPTEALRVLRGLTNKDPYWRARMKLAPDLAKLKELEAAAKVNTTLAKKYQEANGAYFQKVQDLSQELAKEPRAKALFLSATPFAYRKSTDYAEGFLFDYPELTGRYNSPGGQSEFLQRNFGYAIRYNRAEEPGPEVNVGVLEREFYERLKREGVLSGRRLEVEADYDRRVVLVDDAVGAKIDQAMNWLSSEKQGRYLPLFENIIETFNYLAQRRLLEAIKAKHVVPRIKRDLELGRKVVVFHDYNEGGGFAPFAPPSNPNERVRPAYGEKEGPTIGELYSEFIKANPYVKTLDFAQFKSPIETLTKAFPEALVYNGRIPNKQRARARDEFNLDGSGRDIIIVQSAAGEAGISLHDTTGKHQRVLYNLGLPTRPTTAIQQEGRIYREGQVSDAIFRYMSTGTGWERTAFSQTIAERASTAENLALGDEARALRDSFIDSFNDADDIPQGADEGRGGKAKDRTMAGTVSPYEKAKAFYFAEGKKRGRRDQREGTDYYATPEPIGLKMVEFADVQIGERILEPSAGHGAIARWFPEGANRVLIEPSSNLASRAGLASPGAKVITSRFEDHYIGNKYDAIVMNPPFGAGGKDAIDHVQKAVGHLREGGRVVAILPRGPAADKRLEAFRDNDANKNIYAALEIDLPPVMFERAGTKVATRLVVFERHSEPSTAPQTAYRDISDAETINDLFDRMENLSLSARRRENQSPAGQVSADVVERPRQPVAPATAEVSFELGETKHSRTGADLYVASIAKQVPRTTFDNLLAAAKKHKGYYSSFRGSGAIPGFQFPTEENRTAFLQTINGGMREDADQEDFPRVNKEGYILALPYEKEWGNPRFINADRKRAIARLREIQSINADDAAWADLVQAKRDIDQIITNLFYFAPDRVEKWEQGEFKSAGDLYTYVQEVDDPERFAYEREQFGIRQSLFSAKDIPAELAEFADEGGQALDSLLDYKRKGLRSLLRWDDEVDPVKPKRVAPVGKIGDKMPSGFYFKTARKIDEARDTLFQMSGQAVINWLMKEGVSRAEIEHFQLREKFGNRNGVSVTASREDFRDAIAARMFDFRRKMSWLNPERSKSDYELGGTRAFTGPRIPGRGVYFERPVAFPKKLAGGGRLAPGEFESPHWYDVLKNAWASWRGSIREVPGFGQMLVGEEGQSDYMQGASTGRRPKLSQAEWEKRKVDNKVYDKVMSRAFAYVREATYAIRDHHEEIAYLKALAPSHSGVETDFDTWLAKLNDLRKEIRSKRNPDGTIPSGVDFRYINEKFNVLDKLELLRRENESFFAPGANKNFSFEKSKFTPESPIDDNYVRVMARDLLLLAADKNVDSIAVSTSSTTGRIQNNRGAAHFYDQQMKPALERELRTLTHDWNLTLEKVALPKAMGAAKSERPYTVWAAKLKPETLEKIKNDGVSMFSIADTLNRPAISRLDYVKGRILLRQPVDLSKDADRMFDLMRNEDSALPDSIPETVVTKLLPKIGSPGRYIVTARDRDGNEYSYEDDSKLIPKTQGMYLLLDGRPAVTLLPLDFGGDFVKSVVAVRAHESVHALRVNGFLLGNGRDLGSAWGRLVGHADILGVLTMSRSELYRRMGDPRSETASKEVTTLEVYTELYGNRKHARELLDQEAVAHMVEVYKLGGWSEQEVAPIKDLLDDILSGRTGQQERGELALDMLRSVQDTETGQSMRRDLDSLGYYSKALEAARGLKQAKGTPEQMLAQLKKAGVKDAEIEATGLGTLLKEKAGSTTTLESDAITLPPKPVWNEWDSLVERLPKESRDVGPYDLVAERAGPDHVTYSLVEKGVTSPWNENGEPVAKGTFRVKASPNGGIEVTNARIDDPVMQKKGIGTRVYDIIQKDFAPAELMPSSWNQLSPNAFAFWSKRDPKKLAWVRTQLSVRGETDMYPDRIIPQQQGDRTASPPRRAALNQITREEIISHLEANRDAITEKVRSSVVEEGQPLFSLGSDPRSDLDMSPSAWKERAEKMGFDMSKVWYRGRGNPTALESFDMTRQGHTFGRNPITSLGIFASDDEGVASNYAMNHAFANEHGRFMKRAADYRGKSRIRQLLSREPTFEHPEGTGGNIIPFYARPGRQIVIDVSTLPRDLDGRGEELDYANTAIYEKLVEAKRNGYDTAIIRNNIDAESTRPDGTWADELVLFNPADARSVNAEFDPAKDGSPNLMYSDVAAAKPTAKQAKAIGDINEAVNIIQRIAGKEVTVTFQPVIRPENLPKSAQQVRATAAAGLNTQTAGGVYIRDGGQIGGRPLIALATNDERYDLLTSAGHEAFHHVEEALATEAEKRLIKSDAEMKRLLRLASDEVVGTPKTSVDRLYRWVSGDGLMMSPDKFSDPKERLSYEKEVRAIAFQRFRRLREEGLADASKIHIGIRKLWDRIVRVFQGVRNVLKGNGYNSYEAFFERARTGGVASGVARGRLDAQADKAPAGFSIRNLFDRQMRPTGYVSVEPFDLAEMRVARRYMADVPTSAIRTAQRSVSVDAAKAKIGTKTDPVSLFKYGSTYYVNDGNHRVEAAVAERAPSIRSEVIEIVPKGRDDGTSVLADRGQADVQAQSVGAEEAGKSEDVTLARHFGATRIEDIGPNDPHPGRVLAFHATEAEFSRFRVGKALGVHFGTAGQANKIAGLSSDQWDDQGRGVPGDGTRVIPSILNLDKVIDLYDLDNWQPDTVAKEIEFIVPSLEGLVSAVGAASPGLKNDVLRDRLTAEGYSGLRYQNRHESDGGWSYIVWEPGKVISATSGDPLLSLIPTAAKVYTQRWLRRLQPKLDTIRIALQDKVLPQLRREEAIEAATGAVLPDQLRTYMAEAIYQGRAPARLENLERDTIEPLIEHIRKHGITFDVLGDYLYARHAVERNAAIVQIDPTNTAGSGMTDAEAQGVIGALEQGPRGQAFKDAAAMVDKMLTDTRDTLLRSGLITREQYDNWSTKYQHYVPLRGFEADEDENGIPRIGRGMDIRGPEAMQALGRRSKADNPAAYAMQQAVQAIIRSEKNRVDKTLYRAINAHPDPDVWRVFKGEAKRRINPSTGLVEVVWVPPPFAARGKENVFGVKIAGKQYYMEILHEPLARSLRSSPSWVLGTTLGRGLYKASRFYAQLVTSYNPEFVISNYLRDIQTALMNVGDVAQKPDGTRKKIVAEALSLKSIRGVMAALQSHEGRTIFGAKRAADETMIGTKRTQSAQDYAKWFEEYRLAGGKISFIEQHDIDRIKTRIEKSVNEGKTMRGLRNVFDLVDNANSAVENGVRLSVYIALRKNGISQDRAAFTARELTVNFNRKGEYGPAINAFYLFFNASVQGTTRLAQAAMRSSTVRRGLAGIFLAGALMDVMNYMIAADDDDGENSYEKIKDWVKEKNMVVMLPGRKDYVQIPMPYGYNVFFLSGQKTAALVRTAAGHGHEKPVKALAGLLGAVLESFSPLGAASTPLQMAAPTLADPFVQISENKNWFGGPIQPQKFNKNKPDSENFYSTAPAWAIDFARSLNRISGGNTARSGNIDVSPETIEHLVEFAGGGVAKFAANLWNTGERAIKGKEWVPEKTPFVRRVYGKATTDSRRRDFFEKWNEVDAAHFEFDAMRRAQNREGMVDARREYPSELTAYEPMKSAQRQLAALKKQSDAINLNRDLDKDAKEQRLKVITDRENEIILRALATYNRLKKDKEKQKEPTP